MPELAVRHMVYGMGYRYRLHERRLPGSPDLVFWGRRKAIFVHGCFWHGHSACRYARLPKSNVEFWKEKRSRNRRRDRANVDTLKRAGWRILVVWQCELKEPKRLEKTLHDFLEDL